MISGFQSIHLCPVLRKWFRQPFAETSELITMSVAFKLMSIPGGFYEWMVWSGYSNNNQINYATFWSQAQVEK